MLLGTVLGEYRPSVSVLSRPRADILPVRPSRLVNKIYITQVYHMYKFMLGYPGATSGEDAIFRRAIFSARKFTSIPEELEVNFRAENIARPKDCIAPTSSPWVSEDIMN